MPAIAITNTTAIMSIIRFWVVRMFRAKVLADPCVHHWLTEAESKVDTQDCNSDSVKPLACAGGSVNT